jgi:hypothetical protein
VRRIKPDKTEELIKAEMGPIQQDALG